MCVGGGGGGGGGAANGVFAPCAKRCEYVFQVSIFKCLHLDTKTSTFVHVK